MPSADQPASDESFGARIQRLRWAKKLTQRQLADKLGIDYTYLSKLENNRGEPPGEQTVRKLAAELDAEPEDLLALAGKISLALRERAAEDPEFALLLRRLPGLSDDVLRRIYKNAAIGKPSGRSDPPS